MVWGIGSKQSSEAPKAQPFAHLNRGEFRQLRLWLLLSYLGVMALILSAFSVGVYGYVTRSLYRQLDQQLRTLAQSATPTHAKVKARGSQYLERMNEVPWRDIFNRNKQSLEWFDKQGNRLADKGKLSVTASPEVGPHVRRSENANERVRTYTVSVFRSRANSDRAVLEGYIRASQDVQEIEAAQREMLWGFGLGGVGALGLSAVGGLWLTRKSMRPIEQNVAQLRQFTADASHELRSPIAAIQTSVEVMRNHPERFQAKDAKKLDAIASATDQMSDLVENLLFLARTDAANGGATQPDWQPVELADVLSEAMELFEPWAQAKGIQLQWDAEIEGRVLGDAHQLHRLVANLLRNALQHTPSGGTVRLALTRQSRHYRISVTDTGSGIAPEHQALVFNRFWRADRARSHSERGTGLGLAIAQAIAQRHGGRIELSSQPGAGSCFRVWLPDGAAVPER